MIIDIRNKAAYELGHIHGALSFPFIDNPVKWQEQLRNISHPGWYDIKSAFSSFIKSHAAKTVHIYCDTGTWRSHAFAVFAESLGTPVHILPGGYRAFQKDRSIIFNHNYPMIVVGGKTGTGKTALLEELERRGKQVIHLEKLAGHKGSVFGRLDQSGLPIKNEQFKNDLAHALSLMDISRVIWVEDEGKSLGHVGIPTVFWDQMQKAPVIKLELPIERRIQYILNQYGHIDRDLLANSIQKIKNRLGDAASAALTALRNNQLEDVIRIVLNYYDEAYARQLKGRNVVWTIQMEKKSQL
jgi:tRNA 2-selenouridine synthase